MTLCVIVKAHDCIVFAADSASALAGTHCSGNDSIMKIFQHGSRVFELYRSLPICALTAGAGNIGDSSLATLVKDFRLELANRRGKYGIDPATYSIEEVATKAGEFFFNEKYLAWDDRPKGPHSLELWIGGYGAFTRCELWRIQIANGSCGGAQRVLEGSACGIQWSGQPEALNRLVLGYSSRLQTALIEAGIKREDLSELMQDIGRNTKAQLAYPSMPVQDAIRLADFLIETSRRFAGFLPGAEIVGECTDIATITKHEGFKWIRRTRLYSPAANSLEPGHA